VSDAVRLLRAAVDALAAEDIVGVSLRDDVLALERERARFDAEVARRLRAFDRSNEWSLDGSRSAAGFLLTHTRCARGEAYRRVKVARQADVLDATSAAWRAGDVTTGHVEAIAQARHAARADEAFDEFERELVSVARTGTPEDVSNVARQWRDALDADLDRDGSGSQASAELERNRFDFSRSMHGRGYGSLDLDALSAERVETALNRAYDELHRADDPRSPSRQRADALVEICRSFLEARPSRANLPNVLLITSQATLSGDAVGECRLGSGYRISPETARRLTCDAQIQHLLTGEHNVPLALGRAKRRFTPDQFRAMVARDGHCRGPHCRAGVARCQGHHMTEWTNGGFTDLDAGFLVCNGVCHTMLHEGGWTVRGDPKSTLEFYDRNDRFVGSSEPYQPRPPVETKKGRARRARHTNTRAAPGARSP
jgi:hypothetical protein